MLVQDTAIIFLPIPNLLLVPLLVSKFYVLVQFVLTENCLLSMKKKGVIDNHEYYFFNSLFDKLSSMIINLFMQNNQSILMGL